MELAAATAMTANDMADENKSTNNDRLLLAISESSLECDGGGRIVYSPASMLSRVGVRPSFIESISTEMTSSTEQAPSVILSPPLQLQVARMPLIPRSLPPPAEHRTGTAEQLQEQLRADSRKEQISKKLEGSCANRAQDNTNNKHNFTPPPLAAAASQVAATTTTTERSASTNMASQSMTMIDQNQTQNQTQQPTQKKSIFDGASKDEILTYLEDAVERVPELLIAADEVMVMGDNELLLVNQLEPNSPATPISIVETTDDDEFMAGAKERGDGQGPRSSSSSSAARNAEQVGRNLSRATSRKRRTRDELAAGELEQATSTQHLAQLDARNQSTVFLSDQLTRVEGEASSSSLVINNEHHHQPLFGPSLSDSSNRSCDEESPPPPPLASTVLIGARTLSRQQHHHHPRRNSTSATTSTSGGNNIQSECRRRMTLQQHLSKTHDSILTSASSSTSLSPSRSTPASSSSPSSNSRSSSSNQTSGNCSETSNFYTSPSLSCSSPAIGQMNQVASLASASGLIAIDLTSVDSDGNRLLSCTTANQLDNLFEQTCSTQLTATINSADGSAVLIGHDDQSGGLSSLSRPSLECAIEALGLLQVPGNERGDSGFDSASTSCLNPLIAAEKFASATSLSSESVGLASKIVATAQSSTVASGKATSQPIGVGSRTTNSHYATINRLNNYLVNRYRACISKESNQNQISGPSQSLGSTGSGADSSAGPEMVEFQCLDCDQFILADQSRVLNKANELRLLRDTCELESLAEISNKNSGGRNSNNNNHNNQQQQQQLSQLERAYVVALNGLPLCRFCEKKRVERKEIISEFLETELKYGHDLKIIHDEFYRPMQIAGLLNKDQIQGLFSNLDELLLAHCKFVERLKAASDEALAIGDTDYNTVNVGKIFLDQADMLQTFEFYCVRQASAACLLARLAKERDLLRIFLRVSQMENTLLRRMNLAAFLMVPVQRVTKYPLLLNRLYKVTPYYHKDREALRAAQLKVELHLEHINHQTKGISATNKIWRRISNLSTGQALVSARTRGLISAEDINYMKLRKTALELLKWDRDETQFIHSGELSFAPLNEYLIRQKMKSVRYMSAQALLIVVGKPNWRYRPDLVKSHVDYKLLTQTPGGSGIKEAALLLFREKNGRFINCREPLLLSNCVLSNDCSQYNIEPSHGGSGQANKQATNNTATTSSNNNNNNPSSSTQTPAGDSKGCSAVAVPVQSSFSSSSLMSRRLSPGAAGSQVVNSTASKSGGTPGEIRASSADTQPVVVNLGQHAVSLISASNIRSILISHKTSSASSTAAASTANQIQRSVQSKSFSLSSRDSTEMSMADQINNQNNNRSDTVSMTSLKSLPEERINGSSARQTSPPAPSSRSNSLASASSQTSMASTSSAASMNHLSITKPLSCASNKLNPFKSKSNGATNANSSTSSSSSKLVAAAAMAQASGKRWTTMATDGGCAATNQQDPNNKLDGFTNQQQQQTIQSTASSSNGSSKDGSHSEGQHHLYNHHFFHINHQPYGDYEESFEIHERLSKESLLVRADTPLKTRYWLQMLRYHAKDLGHWRQRRPALANIMMMMRQE